MPALAVFTSPACMAPQMPGELGSGTIAPLAKLTVGDCMMYLTLVIDYP